MQGPDQKAHRPKTATRSESSLTFYPAYTFNASATWATWVKLTAHDVHHVLKAHDKYSEITTSAYPDRNGYAHSRDDAPRLLFYLNHPIQFVQLVGVVVGLEEYFEKFWLFTIDDSSGAAIDVKCRKPDKEVRKEASQPGQDHASSADAQTTSREPPGDQLLQTTLSSLQIGMVVQAKGTLATFRSTRQLSLLRLSVIRETTHEMALVAARTSFLNSILSTPWTLSSTDQKKLYKEAQGEKESENRRAARRRMREMKKQEREDKHARLIRELYAREETERRVAAEDARAAGEALPAPVMDGDNVNDHRGKRERFEE